MVIKNEKELRQILMPKIENAVIKAQAHVYQIIDRFVKEFYTSYSPEMYERTYQLYRSLVKSEIRPTVNGYEARVYFDLDSLYYSTGASPSAEQVISAAASGGHGATGLKIINNGGVGIWNDPMQILNTEAINILKGMLISEGIPIK